MWEVAEMEAQRKNLTNKKANKAPKNENEG
jgi:hypothetical protein